MELKVHNIAGEVVGEIALPESIFGVEVRPHLFWEVVRWQQAKKRAGTHQSKTRHFVHGSGKKIYRQKGTGNARHGDRNAPTFVGGGVAHGPHPRSYEFKVNKKARRAALCSALSMKVQSEKLIVVEDFRLSEIKTRLAVSALGALKANRALVVDGVNETLSRSVRNLPNARYLNVAGLNVYDLLKYDAVVITRSALESLEGRLSA